MSRALRQGTVKKQGHTTTRLPIVPATPCGKTRLTIHVKPKVQCIFAQGHDFIVRGTQLLHTEEVNSAGFKPLFETTPNTVDRDQTNRPRTTGTRMRMNSFFSKPHTTVCERQDYQPQPAMGHGQFGCEPDDPNLDADHKKKRHLAQANIEADGGLLVPQVLLATFNFVHS